QIFLFDHLSFLVVFTMAVTAHTDLIHEVLILEQWLRWMHLWILQKRFQVPSGLLLKPIQGATLLPQISRATPPTFGINETESCDRSAASTVAAHTNTEMVLRDKSSNYSPKGRVAKLPEPI